MMVSIKKFVFYLFEECTYVIWDEEGVCVIVDPGCERPGEKAELSDFITSKGLRPKAVLLTHGHLDHIYGARFCQDTYSIPVMMDKREEGSINLFNPIYTAKGLHVPPAFTYTEINDGDLLQYGGLSFRVLSTPGHTFGGVCYWMEKDGLIFTGDTLFAGSVGRTDNDNASYDALMKSLRQTLMNLDSAIEVLPGHGQSTTIGVERCSNPFIYEMFDDSEG